MIIKSFIAENSSSAMKKVRLEMGGDAIVLKTRNVTDDSGNSRVEVTACLEKPSVSQSSLLLASPRRDLNEIAREISPVMPKLGSEISPGDEITEEIILASPPTEPTEKLTTQISNLELNNRIENIEIKLNQILTQLSDLNPKSNLSVLQDNLSKALHDSDFPDEFIKIIISDLTALAVNDDNFQTEANKILTLRLSAMMLPSLSIKSLSKVMFIGPAGSGKSSVLSKMAASLISVQKETVKLMSLDDMKLGAHEELNTCADFLGIETIEKNEISNKTDDKAIWLIDTPALQKNSESLKKIEDAIKTIKPDLIFAVFSAVTRSKDIKEFSNLIMPVKPTHLVITMTDLTDCIGTLAEASMSTGAKIAFVTDKPGGRPLLKSPEPALYASRLMNCGDNNE